MVLTDVFRVVVFGDVVGQAGVKALQHGLSEARAKFAPNMVIVNGENMAQGLGMTKEQVDALFRLSVDVVTSGNHVWHKHDILNWIDSEPRVLRPLNFPENNPGHGVIIIERTGMRIAVLNLIGRVFMDPHDSPFTAVDRALEALQSERVDYIFVDFHAEATGEKEVMGYYLDGRVTAVWGTHTHVQTADERILPGGTAYISDIGCCKALNSVLGVRIEHSTRVMVERLPVRFHWETEGPLLATGILIDIDLKTKKPKWITRIRFEDKGRF